MEVEISSFFNKRCGLYRVFFKRELKVVFLQSGTGVASLGNDSKKQREKRCKIAIMALQGQWLHSLID